MPDLLTADIERMLRDSRDEIDYPATPDIAVRALSRIQPGMPAHDLPPGSIATTPSPGPVSRVATRPIPLDAGRSGLPGQFIRLAAAIVAFIVVGGLLVALFQLTGRDDDEQQAAPASGTRIQDRLYVLTHIPNHPGESTGRFTAYDAATHEELYSLDVAYASQVAIAPDGSRIYLMSREEDNDHGSLIAVHAEDGSLIWRAPQTRSTVGYISGGPPSMAISPDGSRLHLYVSRRDGDTFLGFSVLTIDANTGATIGEVETSDGTNSGCTPQMHATPSNGRVFLACWTGYRLLIFDLGMGRFTYDIDLPARDTIGSELQSTDSIVGSVQSPDSDALYVVSNGPRINIVDLGRGELEETHDIAVGEPARVHRGLVALSDDGTRLALGIQTVNHDNGLHDVGRIIVVDTTTWQTVADLSLDPALHDPPMTGHSMTFNPDGSALYITETEYEDGSVNIVESSSVVRIEIATGEREVVVEANEDHEQIWRVFSGRVDESQSLEPAGQDDAWPSMLLLDLNPDVPGPDKLQVRPVDPDTLDNVEGLQPISVGQHWQHALSPDGRTLAAFTWPTQEPVWGALRLLDLTTWQTTVVPVTNIGRVSDLSFTPDGQSLYWVAGDYVAGEFVLWRYDLATEQAWTVTTFPRQFVPWELRMLGDNRLAVYGVPTDSGNLNVGDPRVIVVNFDDGTIVADIVLEGVKAGQHREDVSRSYYPGLAWDTERELLYVVHADDDVITLVDLERGVAETTTFAPEQSLSDRLLDWLVPTAAAKGGPASGRQAILSNDGRTLFIAPASDHNTWWREDLNQYPLQVIDTANLSESREIDLPAISDMRLSPDGELLVVQTYVHAEGDDGQPGKTSQQIIGLAVDDLQQVGAVGLPGVERPLIPSTTYVIQGFSADDAVLYLTRRQSVVDPHTVELLVLDLETWTATVARTLDDTWFGELVMPVQ